MKSIKSNKLKVHGKDKSPFYLRLLSERRLMYVIAAYIITCGALLYPFFGGAPPREGDIAKKDYISPATTTFIDTAATGHARNQAARTAGKVYRIQPSLNTELDTLFKSLASVFESGDTAARQNLAENLTRQGLSAEAVSFILSLNGEEVMTVLRLDVYATLRHITVGGILTDSDLKELDKHIEGAALKEEVTGKYMPAVLDIIRVYVTDNLEVDTEASETLKEEARNRVSPVKGVVKKDEIIVGRGRRITQHHIDIFNALGIGQRVMSNMRLGGICLFTALVFLITGVVMKNHRRKVYNDEKRLAIFLILIVLTVTSSVLLSVYSSGYLIGASVGAMSLLVGFMLDPLLVVFAVPLLSGVIVLATGLQLGHFVVAVVISIVAYIFVSRRRLEDALLRGGAAIWAGSIITIFSLTLLNYDSLQQAFMDVAVFGSLNGILSFVMAMGLMPAFEKIFNITTPHRLLELSNPAQPLLRRLLVEAPGTYHHSISVANLAETAAELVGADALLVRTAAYYHDIGKLKRPYFFTENQLTPANQFSGVSPTLGSLVISSHVKDGIDLAREHNLPHEITAIIPQHHGTNLISFFYQEAKDEAVEGEKVSKERYRYGGPKPQSLEAAIIMLADSSEASVRSLREPTPKNIETLVNTIVKKRLIDGQLDECNITLQQIDTVRKTFIQTLSRMYHSRVEYPELKEEEIRHAPSEERPEL
ncbi:MAG: HDIG domain-containing metalloprotein [bacterium]